MARLTPLRVALALAVSAPAALLASRPAAAGPPPMLDALLGMRI